MNWEAIDWRALERMRQAFLDGRAGRDDYWRRPSDLASYNATFAQRIGWKWDYVLTEMHRRGWSPPEGDLLDWGCGSGIAHRAFLDFYGREQTPVVHLWDRSALATHFAAERAKAKYPGLRVQSGIPQEMAVALVSHVLTELEPAQTEALADTLSKTATAILWVEPGTYEASLTLIAVRERLRNRFQVIAPCPHQARCGLLHPGNERHWCHHFASPPPEVFVDSNWGKFARLAGIDLCSLPLSFLVLDKRPASPLPTGAMRLIGRPRITKPAALLLGCNAFGVQEYRAPKRHLPELYRQARKATLEPLQVCQAQGDEIKTLKPWSREHADVAAS